MDETVLWVQCAEKSVARPSQGVARIGVGGKSMRCKRSRCGGWSQVRVWSPSMVCFGTDQSDILCYIHMAIGQYSLQEHPQVEPPILQGRGP